MHPRPPTGERARAPELDHWASPPGRAARPNWPSGRALAGSRRASGRRARSHPAASLPQTEGSDRGQSAHSGDWPSPAPSRIARPRPGYGSAPWCSSVPSARSHTWTAFYPGPTGALPCAGGRTPCWALACDGARARWPLGACAPRSPAAQPRRTHPRTRHRLRTGARRAVPPPGCWACRTSSPAGRREALSSLVRLGPAREPVYRAAPQRGSSERVSHTQSNSRGIRVYSGEYGTPPSVLLDNQIDVSSLAQI